MKPCNESEIVGLNATYRKYYLKGYEDAEKEHNYHLKKIRAEIEKIANEEQKHDEKWAIGLRYAVKIIDKYRAESEE